MAKFSKKHLANLRAAHAKRRKSKPTAASLTEAIIMHHNEDTAATIGINMSGLIDRMTQAIDKIQAQIERLETL